MKIKLTDDIIKDIDNRHLKAKKLVKFVLDKTNGITDKELDQTALQDIKINNQFIKNVMFNVWVNELIIQF